MNALNYNKFEICHLTTKPVVNVMSLLQLFFLNTIFGVMKLLVSLHIMYKVISTTTISHILRIILGHVVTNINNKVITLPL